MTLLQTHFAKAAIAESRPPAWVNSLATRWEHSSQEINGQTVQLAQSGEFSLAAATVSGARRLSPQEFESRTMGLYLALEQVLGQTRCPHPVRLWNHIPDIHAPAGDGSDRYMLFNAGRYRAYSQWLGGVSSFDRSVPAASATGHDGEDLIVHALAASAPGLAVANPRQIAPYRYSRRFGPLPPCFARATVLPATTARATAVLVGGTASIRGEDSLHIGDLPLQFRETFDNLAYLLRAAGDSGDSAEMSSKNVLDWLAHFRHVRIYFVREKDRQVVESHALRAFGSGCDIEYIRADLCRADLLVEIEGLADG